MIQKLGSLVGMSAVKWDQSNCRISDTTIGVYSIGRKFEAYNRRFNPGEINEKMVFHQPRFWQCI